MGTKLNKEAYKELIKEDMEKVEKYFPEHSLEKKHIQEVLRCSIECYYPSEGKQQPSTESKCNKHIVKPSYFKCRHFNKRQFLVEFICKANDQADAEKQFKKEYKNRYNLIEVLPL